MTRTGCDHGGDQRLDRLRQALARQDIEGSRAHAAMLAATGILRDSDAEAIREGCSRCCQRSRRGTFAFSTALEDIHMNVEARLKELVGEPAGRLHTARSRNDQVALDFRLWVRDAATTPSVGLTRADRALLARPRPGADWVMPGFTHLQTAQPVTWGHHMMAYVEMFGRDRVALSRRAGADERMPAGRRGAGRHGFPIDRDMTARRSASTGRWQFARRGLDRDFALEFLARRRSARCISVALAEELVIWSSAQFASRAVGPVLDRLLDHAAEEEPRRGRADPRQDRAHPRGAVALFTVMKGLPLAYSKDMQEDKEARSSTPPIQPGWRWRRWTGWCAICPPNRERAARRGGARLFHRDRSGRLAGAGAGHAVPRRPSRDRRAGGFRWPR
jgi:argininosuccinate lyase